MLSNQCGSVTSICRAPEVLRVVHVGRPMALLREGEVSTPVRRGCLWPLIVVWVEVPRDDAAARSFVSKMFVSCGGLGYTADVGGEERARDLLVFGKGGVG